MRGGREEDGWPPAHTKSDARRSGRVATAASGDGDAECHEADAGPAACRGRGARGLAAAAAVCARSRAGEVGLFAVALATDVSAVRADLERLLRRVGIVRFDC